MVQHEQTIVCAQDFPEYIILMFHKLSITDHQIVPALAWSCFVTAAFS